MNAEPTAKITKFTADEYREAYEDKPRERVRLVKTFSIDEDTGKVKKGDPGKISTGTYATHDISLEQLMNEIAEFTEQQALGLGTAEKEKGKIGFKHWKDEIRRTKENFHYGAQSTFCYLDLDGIDLSPNETIEIISDVSPGFADAGKLIVPSSSAGLYSANGELLKDSTSAHIYFIIQDGTDAHRFMAVLFDRLWLAGHGFYMLSAAPSLLKRGIIDTAVVGAERLVYEGAPLLLDGITQKRPDPVHIEGGTVDTTLTLDLTIDEKETLEQIRQEEREKIQPELERAVSKKVDRIVKNRNVTKAVAQEIVIGNQKGILDDSDVLYFASCPGGVSVGDVLNDPATYDGKALADPLEPDYEGGSKTKAKFYWNDGQPIIHSYAHGSFKYTFKRFEPVIRRSYEEILGDVENLTMDSDEEVTLLINQAALLSPIQNRRISEAIKKVTKLPFYVQKNAHKADCDEDEEDEKDDLQLAKELAEKIGRDNIIAALSDVYEWKFGVWQKLDTRYTKQLVQQHLGDKDFCKDDVGKSKVESVADLFKTEIFRSDHQFDIGPAECVNMVNGELQLSGDYGAWSLQIHNRENYRTTQIPVEYAVTATAPRFLKFMEEIFKGDPDATSKTKALMEMIGYTLMAHCRQEKFIILVGIGANGKSVFLAILEALLGTQNVAGVQPSQFDRSFQRAHLHGKLANIVTEIKQGEVIDDASLKGIVSGEPTTVEHKFKHPFTMRPFSTCWFGTNHMPHTRDFSDALFRRALVVEFNQVFKPEFGNCDPTLKDKLMGELPGILNIALGAYANALINGFTMPESCITARENWRLEADQVAQFVDDLCERGDGCSVLGVTDLFAKYKYWADESGIQMRLGIKAFRDRLSRLGFGQKRTRDARLVTGIRLKAHYEEFLLR